MNRKEIITFLLLLFGNLILIESYAQVVQTNDDFGFADNTNSLTLTNFAVTGSSNLLLVVHWQGTNPPTDITFNGSSLSVDPTGRVWTLPLGNTATTADIIFTLPASTSGFAMALSFSGASQASPIDAVQSQSVSNATITQSISSQTGDLVLDFIAAINLGGGCSTPSLTFGGSPQVEHINETLSITGFCGKIGASTSPGSASVDMSWTISNSSTGDHYVVNINQFKPSNNVGIGTSTPHPSAALEINSSEQGLLIPGLTTAERDALDNPAEGLLIYNVSDDCFNYYADTSWYKDCGRSLSADTEPLIPLAEGGTDDDYGYGITSDTAGNVYIVGSFAGTFPIGGTNLVSPGDSSIFITKYDPSGSFTWAKHAGGNMKDEGFGIVADESGNLYISGTFKGTATIGDTMVTSQGDSDGFIAKYNTDGDFIWAEQFGGSGEDVAGRVAVDPSGNVLVTGYFSGMSTFDGTSVTSAGNTDAFIAKYDNSGSLLWVRKGGGTNEDSGFGITSDASGNVIVNGWFEQMATFESTTLTSGGKLDVFTAKYSGSGALLWIKQGEGVEDGRGFGVTSDSDDNIYITGWFFDEIEFGTSTLTNSSSTNLFLVKYDPSGNIEWAKNSEGSGGMLGYGIDTDLNDNILLTGLFAGAPSISTQVLSPIGNTDIFTLKYTPDGTFKWVRTGGGTMEDYSFDITVVPSGIAYATGGFEGQATFGSTTYTSFGGKDMFLTLYNSSGDQTQITNSLSGSQDNDSDPTNELQNWGNLPGIPADFSDNLDDVNDADSDPTNELVNSIFLNGNFLELNDAGGTKIANLSTLPLESTTVSNGNTIALTLTNSDITAESILDPNPLNILSSSFTGLLATESDPKVGINTTNFLSKWDGSQLVASTSVFEDATGKLGIGRPPTTNILEVEGTASKTSAGDWVANSDARLKSNIKRMDSKEMLHKILDLKGITFEWNDHITGTKRPKGTMYGFTAQNIKEVFPELVQEDNLGFLQTAYGTYDAMYVEAIRAQQQQIEELQDESNTQKTEIDLLKAQLNEMETLKKQLIDLQTNMNKIQEVLSQKADATINR